MVVCFSSYGELMVFFFWCLADRFFVYERFWVLNFSFRGWEGGYGLFFIGAVFLGRIVRFGK